MKYEEHFKISCEKRDEYWNKIGEPFTDVIGNMINPSFMGGPRWPSLRQAHIGIKIDNGTIISTDGLSDPYDDYDNNADNQNYNGIGIEIYSISENKFKSIQEIIESWEFKIIKQVSNLVASNPNISNTLNEYKFISTTINGAGLPQKFINDDGGTGILLGIENNIVQKKLQLSIENISLVNVTLLMKNELDYILENGADARNEIANKMKDKGYYKLQKERKSVI